MIDLQNINFETLKVYFVWAQRHSTLELAPILDGNVFNFDFETQFGILKKLLKLIIQRVFLAEPTTLNSISISVFS